MVTGYKARSCAASVVNDNLKRSVSEAFFRVTRRSLHVANAHGIREGMYYLQLVNGRVITLQEVPLKRSPLF